MKSLRDEVLLCRAWHGFRDMFALANVICAARINGEAQAREATCPSYA